MYPMMDGLARLLCLDLTNQTKQQELRASDKQRKAPTNPTWVGCLRRRLDKAERDAAILMRLGEDRRHDETGTKSNSKRFWS